METEAKAAIDFEITALQLAAERKLMILFHGCQKPTGEARTYPNEITREAIRGLELNKMAEGPIPAWHNAALPFTRFVAGHADYTPVGFSNPGPTTFAHQLATDIIFTSGLQNIAEHPYKLLNDAHTKPALDILKAVPSVWDETRVLKPSRIGRLACFARRSGDTWFLAALNAEPMILRSVDLSFLGAKSYRAVFLSSPTQLTFARREVAKVDSRYPLRIKLGAGDGFVAMFKPATGP
jgi:alpha-glucosidase